MVGLNMAGGTLLEMGLGPCSTSTVIYFLDMGSGLVLSLRHPLTIGILEIWWRQWRHTLGIENFVIVRCFS